MALLIRNIIKQVIEKEMGKNWKYSEPLVDYLEDLIKNKEEITASAINKKILFLSGENRFGESYWIARKAKKEIERLSYKTWIKLNERGTVESPYSFEESVSVLYGYAGPFHCGDCAINVLSFGLSEEDAYIVSHNTDETVSYIFMRG
jgi:hypothetical protein